MIISPKSKVQSPKLNHQPVLLKEVLQYLQPKENQNFVDCTYGSGGHSDAILMKVAPEGKVLAIDLDEKNIATAKLKVKSQKSKVDRLIFIRDNFKNLREIIEKQNFTNISGILLDLGVSSRQLNEADQGFGFQSDKLDMRFDKSQALTVEEIINQWPAEKLAEIFRDYGEERLAKPIAKEIAAVRKKEKIVKPSQLVEVVQQIYRRFYKKPSWKNPATKVFLALRIAVNDELNNLEAVLPQAVAVLKGPSTSSSRLGSRSATGPGGLSVNSGPGGRLAVISFHSLEDRIVKEFFRRESKDCLCPPEFFVCQCNHQATLKVLTKKPVVPREGEIAKNPRARSAKLRVAERVERV